MSFTPGPTRQVQPGDTPDLNDGLLSRQIADGLVLERGAACLLKAGKITLATITDVVNGYAPFVPIESVDNTGNGLEASGVGAPQRVALRAKISSLTLNPGDYVKPSSVAGEVEAWVPVTGETGEIYARYLGKEAGLFQRESGTPWKETLSNGIKPDQALVPGTDPENNIGWFQLTESQGGKAPAEAYE